MRRITRLLPLWLAIFGQVYARQDPVICGTTRDRWKEQLSFHRTALKRRARLLRARALQVPAAPPAAARDAGEIAILDDADGVVARLNDFDLDQRTLTFWGTAPAAAQYQFGAGSGSYDAAAASGGTLVAGLGDDDTRAVALPFPFPFFGTKYEQVFVNSDGNLTFGSGDSASSDRSLGRLTAGPPRIAPLFRDLDPAAAKDGGVRVLSAPDRFVVSWVSVPEYSDGGSGTPQTFQARLYPNGRIEFAWAGIDTQSAVVGISPGKLQGSSAIVSFTGGSSQLFGSTIAERFGNTNELDVVTAAQKFYETHEDAYDYLVFFNNLGIAAADGAVSWEITLRNHRSGYGDEPIDAGGQFGSPARLQSVMNMGPLSQYPDDPKGIVDARLLSRDTPVSVLAHEAGHLFLAYASVRDPADARARPMLGFQLAHWAFTFNSEASLLEGERIRDNQREPQAGISARFSTIGVTEGFSPLDQYLMGFRAPEEVDPVFLATNASVSPLRHPQLGVNFEGERRDVSVQDVIGAEGRRTPDSTVAQRRFRFAFILVTKAGTEPPDADLKKLDAFRQQFEVYYHQAAGERAWADTSLRKALSLSTAPAAGLVQGGSITATVNLQMPADTPLTVYLKTPNGVAGAPPQITIPLGATQAEFTLSGLKAGVEELSAEPADRARYETGWSRIQVAGSAAGLKLVPVSGGGQAAKAGVRLPSPVVLRAVDINGLPYPGLRVVATVSGGGTLSASSGVTDAAGMVRFVWTPGPGPMHQLTAALEAAPAVTATVTELGSPIFNAEAVLNAASYEAPVAPGSLAALFGANLAGGHPATAGSTWPTVLSGVRVLVNGKAVPLRMVNDGEIDFLVPADTPPGTAGVAVSTPVDTSATVQVPVASAAPGIFLDRATNLGVVRSIGGGWLEIYCTGLGPVHADGELQRTDRPVRVFIGGVEATEINFSGLAPGYPGGMYQVDAHIPAGVGAGLQPLYLVVDGVRSNEVNVVAP